MSRVSDNDNIELKKRSRRRLVGAAALALIAAIVLPMVMDDEPVVAVRDIQVTIPTPEARPIAQRDLVDAPSDVGEVSAGTDVREGPEVEQALRPAEPVAAPPLVRAPEPAPKPAAPPRPPAVQPASPPPAVTPPPDSVEAARARAILEGRAPPQSAPAPVSDAAARGFVVQVGAFSDPAKAGARQIELAARGFNSFIETADGVSRVRVGPFSARGDAEAMLRRLREASIDGVVSTR